VFAPYRNPVKRCNKKCSNCMKMETKSFAYSTTKATRTPITPPPPNQNYNCMSRNIVYLITCKYKNCGAQYVGYSMRQLQERFVEHKTTYESPVGRHCLALNHFDKLTIQILTQIPAPSERNPEINPAHRVKNFRGAVLATSSKFPAVYYISL
jgi:hypothetical protein